MTPPSSSPSKLASIEAARGLAALAVVLMHATHLMRVPQFSGHVGLGGVFDFGYVGVDFFFVLSGFIITYVHHRELGRGVNTWPAYLWKRLVRVFPIYWLVLALSALPSMAARALAGRTPLSELGTQDAAGTLLLWIGGGEPKYVGVAWSLQFEILFYLSFCLLLLHRRAGLVLYAAWGALVVAQAMSPGAWALPWRLGDPHCLQFLMGVAAGLLARRAVLPLWRFQPWVLVAAGTAAVLYERLGPQGPHAFGGRLALGLVAAAALLTLLAMEQRRPVRVPAGLAQLGAASYSVYLAHCLLINVVLVALARTGLYARLPEAVIFLIAVATGVVGGTLIGRYVELPMVAWLRRRTASAPASVPAATA